MKRNFFCLLLALLALCVSLPVQAQDPARFDAEIQQLVQSRDSLRLVAPILFVGSSTIRMWQWLLEDFPDMPILNMGFGGSHMSDLLHHAENLVVAVRPRKIFIYEGDNDLSSGKSPGRVMRDTRRLLRLLGQQLPGVPVVLISAKPSPSRWDKRKRYETFNRRLEKLCHRRPELAYADTWFIMLDEQGIPRGDIFLQDQLHMNRKGYELWAEALRPYL